MRPASAGRSCDGRGVQVITSLGGEKNGGRGGVSACRVRVVERGCLCSVIRREGGGARRERARHDKGDVLILLSVERARVPVVSVPVMIKVTCLSCCPSIFRARLRRSLA